MIHILECHCMRAFGYRYAIFEVKWAWMLALLPITLETCISYEMMVDFFDASICSYIILV